MHLFQYETLCEIAKDITSDNHYELKLNSFWSDCRTLKAFRTANYLSKCINGGWIYNSSAAIAFLNEDFSGVD